MKFLTTILRLYNIDMQPTNSQEIDIPSAKTLLYPGAHIAAGNIHEHYHHGIVVDLTNTDISIVHFWGVKKQDARIQTTTLPIFIAGGIDKVGSRNRHLYVVNYPDDTLDKQLETSRRTKEMLEEPDRYKYNLFKLNCESFAYFCRIKKWKSEQAIILQNFPVNQSKQICRKIKGAHKRHVWDIVSLYKGLPTDVLSSSERNELKELCREYALSV